MPLARLELWTAPQAAGGTRVASAGFLPYRTAWSTTRSLINPEQMTFTIPGNSEAASVVHKGQTARLWKEDGTFSEWPVDTVVTKRDAGSDVNVTCVPIAFMLGTHGIITDPIATPANGIPATVWGFSGLTLTEMINTYILGNASVTSVLPWLTLGTIEPTTKFDLDVQDVNVLSLINAALSQLATLGVLAEFSFTPNGTSSYNLNIYNTIGSSASPFFIRVGKNLRTLQLTSDGSQQYSRLSPKLGAINDEPTAIGLSRWKITNVASNVLTLADPAGGAGPVGFDNQLNGWYVYIENTGSLVLITASSASAQTVTVSSGTGITAGMTLQFRTNNSTPAGVPTYLDWPLYTSTTPPGIGIVAGQIDKSSLQAVANLVPNGAMRTWTDPGIFPDGWTLLPTDNLAAAGSSTPFVAGSSMTTFENTDSLFDSISPHSLGFSAYGGTIVTPPAKIVPWYTGMPISARLRLIVTGGWELDRASFMFMRLGIMLSDGTIDQWFDNGRVAWVQPGNVRGVPYGSLAGGQFVDIELVDQQIIPSTMASSYRPVSSSDITALSGSALGLVLMLTIRAQALTGQTLEPITGYIDSAMIVAGDGLPDSQSEFGDANTAWQSTNVGLSLVAPPQRSYQIDLLDRARLGIDADASAVPTLGGTAILFDEELGIAFDDQRIVEIKENQLVEGDTVLTLSNKNKRLTDLLLQGSSSSSKSAGTVKASSGSAATGGTSGTGGTGGGSSLSAPSVSLTLDASDVPTFTAAVGATITKIKYAWSTSAQPDFSTTSSGTEIDAPTAFSASTSAISVGQTIYVSVIGYDALGQATPLGFAHISAVATIRNNVPLIFAEGDMSYFQADSQYNWDGGMTYKYGSGRAGGNCWSTEVSKSQALLWSTDVSAEVGTIFSLNLNSATIPSNGQLLVQFINGYASFATLVIVGLDSSRHVVAYRDDSPTDVLLGTSTDTVPSTGWGQLEIKVKIHATTGYLVVRYIPEGSTASSVLLDLRNINTLPNLGATGDKVGIVSWGSDAFTTSAFHSGGVAGIYIDDIQAYDWAGKPIDDYIGYVRTGSTIAASDGDHHDIPGGHYTDVNVTEPGGYVNGIFFASNNDLFSVGIAPVSNVSTVLGVVPVVVFGGNSSVHFRAGVRSGTTDTDFGVDFRGATFSAWDSAFVDFTSGDNVPIGMLTDPATSAPWTLAGLEACQPYVKAITLNTGANVPFGISQMGVTFTYRPTAGGEGMGACAGSPRGIPVTPMWFTGFDTQVSGQELKMRLGGSGLQGDFFTDSTHGSDASNAGTIDSTYSGGRPEVIVGFLTDTNYNMPVAPNTPVGNYWWAYLGAAMTIDMRSVTLASEFPIIRFFDNSSVEHVRVQLDTSRHVQVIRMDTTPVTLATSTATVAATGLEQIDVEVMVAGSSLGFVHVWLVDTTGTRTQIINYSGQTAKNNSTTNGIFTDELRFFGVYSGTNGDGIKFDDLVVYSLGTTKGGTGLGGKRVGFLKPAGAGTYNDSTAHDYTKVIDDNGTGAIPDGDYNVFTAANKKDTYTLTAVASDAPSTIKAAIVRAYVSLPNTGSSSDTGRPIALVNGSLMRGFGETINKLWPDGNSAGAQASQVQARQLLLRTNPSDGGALTKAILNTMEAGWETLSHTNDTWLRQIAVEYLYDWVP